MGIRFSVIARGVTRTYAFRKDVVTIGRSKNCTIGIDDPALSRTHCQIEVEKDSVSLRDLNSRNGTRLNGERVSRAALEPGDEIALGQTLIAYHGREAPALRDEAGAAAQLTANLFETAAGRRRRPKDTEGEMERLRRLVAINRRIASELDLTRVLPMILDEAIELVAAERGFLVSVDAEGLSVPVARDFWRKDIPEPAFEVSRSIAREVIRRGEPVITDDATKDVRFEEMVSVYDLDIRSVICVPLKVREKAIGALYLDNRFSRGIFTQDDAGLLAAFADQAAISLANSGRFDRTRELGTRWRRAAAGREHELKRLTAQLRELERADGLRHDYAAVVGRSRAMRDVLRLVDRVTDVDLPVLIHGESGTGKELLARTIHGNGPRHNRPFVVVDCAALPAGLIENELFGHGPGAFSGSVGERPGLVESADGGTLFLDEISDAAHELQSVLLRVLESGEVRRLGESSPRPIDVRVIASTRARLDDLMASGAFREDLFFRLKGVEIELPPLRRRVEDIVPLLERFLAELDPEREITPKAIKKLCAYSWPGNVRELENEVRRLLLTVDGPIGPRDLPPHITAARPGGPMVGLKDQVARLEKDLILRALDAHGGNKSRAAEALGLSRLGLRKKMDRLGIDG